MSPTGKSKRPPTRRIVPHPVTAGREGPVAAHQPPPSIETQSATAPEPPVSPTAEAAYREGKRHAKLRDTRRRQARP